MLYQSLALLFVFTIACSDAVYVELDMSLDSITSNPNQQPSHLNDLDMEILSQIDQSMMSMPKDQGMMSMGGTVQVDPNPVDPNPVDPNPVDPDPVDPNPVDPDPVDPNPVDPNPVDPDPVDPDPVDPDPVDPCMVNCEALADCAQTDCRGYRGNNRNLFVEACHLDCVLAESLEGLACIDQINTFNQNQSIFKQLCGNRANTSPCLQSCSDTADCIINQCNHYTIEDRNYLVSSCLMNCNPTVANTLNTLDCSTKIQYVGQALPAIPQNCQAAISNNRNECTMQCELLALCATRICPDYSSDDLVPLGANCVNACSYQFINTLNDKLACIDKVIYVAGLNSDFASHCD
jgi:hypothetical protein